MILVGTILLVLGFLLGISIMWTLGVIALVVGLILLAFGSFGTGIGGRRHFW